MARFVTIDDFKTGELLLATNYLQDPDLQSFIDRVEPDVLQDMLGCDLYNLFIADWDAVPSGSFSEPRFQVIYDAFCEDKDCYILKSEGIKQMLMYFIYFEYIRFQTFQDRTTGMKKTISENSERALLTEFGLFEKYNKGVKNYTNIQIYICDNSGNYPEYNGQNKNLASWL